MEQTEALAAMALALLASLTKMFLDEQKRRMEKTHPPDPKGYKGKGLIRQVAEYRARFNMDLEGIEGFETMREVELARNCCLHNGGAPTEDYKTQTKQRLLDEMVIINLTPEQLDLLIKELGQFIDSVSNQMREVRKKAAKIPASTTTVPQIPKPAPSADDTLTICAISVVAGILTNVLHEGVGHGLTALLTGANSGELTTVAWSSAFDSRLVEAGGTLVNLAAALVFWLALHSARHASLPTRYFLLITCAFNLFTGTGYFFFSGVTNFGDWAAVISGLHLHWLWRALLVVVGACSYFAAVLFVGIGFVRYVGIPRHQQGRLRKFTIVPYLSAILLASVAGLLNPLGIQLLWQSALPATAGGQSGLLWLQYYIPRQTEPKRSPEHLARSYVWIGVAAVLGIVYVVVLGRGITLHR